MPLDCTVGVGTDRLSVRDVVEVARHRRKIAKLAPAVREGLEASASWVASTVANIASAGHGEAIAYYGINTGFGARAGRTALDSPFLIKTLGRNLIASHSVGVGPYFDEAEVRAALLIRGQSLARGYSGVRPIIVETLCAMLNAGLYPAVPEQGSLGASGDLAPLAHLVLVMSGAPPPQAGAKDTSIDRADGEAFVRAAGDIHGDDYFHVTEDYTSGAQALWRRVPGATAMAAVGGKLELEAKEALALTNGSTFSAALAALAVYDAENLLTNAELIVAMTLEGIRGFRDPFYPFVHQARGHGSAERFARSVLDYTKGSGLLDPGDLETNPRRVPPQDPYSVRCAPQVHGTIADAIDLAKRWVEMEINAATDNPLINLDLKRDYKTVSGGNFHGEPIAMGMDFLSIALTDMGNMSDRRMFMMLDYHSGVGEHGLSSFLVEEPADRQGLNSGLMMLQATAASLVSECKALAHPDSIDSIPSSGNQEDHVSMSLNAARHARDVVRNIEKVLALELLCAAQAVWLQLGKPGNGGLRMGVGTSAAYDVLRAEGVAPFTQDRVLFPDIRRAHRLIQGGELVSAAQTAIRAAGSSV
jgi:histidine ammonia-lyase